LLQVSAPPITTASRDKASSSFSSSSTRASQPLVPDPPLASPHDKSYSAIELFTEEPSSSSREARRVRGEGSIGRQEKNEGDKAVFEEQLELVDL
jgi:hypothetical protein